MKIGLALGSGAARIFTHIPILQQLLKEGIVPCAVSGTSSGAIIGAYYALHGEIDSIMEQMPALKKGGWLRFADFQIPKLSVLKGAKIKEFMVKNLFGDATFKDTKIPLVICASNIDTHKPKYFRSGKIIDAVMASITLPGIFPPYAIGKEHYIDGGAFDPVPTNELLKTCDKVIGVNLNHVICRGEERSLNAFPILAETYFMMLDSRKAKTSERVFMISPEFNSGVYAEIQFSQWKTNWDIGEKELAKVMPKLKKWLRA